MCGGTGQCRDGFITELELMYPLTGFNLDVTCGSNLAFQNHEGIHWCPAHTHSVSVRGLNKRARAKEQGV